MTLHAIIALPAIGQNDRTRRYCLLDKSDQTIATDIWNLLKTYTAKAFRFIYFDSRHYNSFLFNLSARQSFFCTADVGLINFNMPMQQVPPWTDHRSTKLVQPTPGRLVTPKSENSLKPQGIASKLLIRYMPHCQKPYSQWFTSALKNRTCGNLSLPLTSSATNLLPSCQPAFCYATGGANKSSWPTQPQQIRDTGGFIRKPFVKFLHRSWVINTADRVPWRNWVVHTPIL